MLKIKSGDCILALDSERRNPENRLRRVYNIDFIEDYMKWTTIPHKHPQDHKYPVDKIFLVYSPTDPTKMYYPIDEIEIIVKHKK